VELLSEEEQWEALKARLRIYAPAIILGLAIGVAIWFGWRWYGQREETALQDASDRYETLVSTYERGDVGAGNTQLEALRREHPDSIYATAGMLAQAKVLVSRGELDAAAASLAAVASKDEQELGRVARLRLARVQIEQAKYDDALKTLDEGAAGAGAYAGPYAHVRGDALLRKGDTEGALREYRRAREELAKVAQTAGAAEATALLDLKINDLQGGDKS
jgi:predicted negative regulator of RcsB-dependent stress response